MMKKFWTILLTGAAMFLGCTLHASAANVRIYDEAGRLLPEDYEFCVDCLQSASDQTGMNIAVVLGKQVRSEYMIENLADETYDEMFGKNTDGLLYYMDLSGAELSYDYISTSGMGQFYYSDGDMADRINAIFDDVFPYLYPKGNEDVVGAIEALADDVVYFYEVGIPENYYIYDDVYEQYFYIKDGKMQASNHRPYVDFSYILTMGAFGFFIGLIVALIVFFAVKSHYKFKASFSPTAYINRKNLVFSRQYDNFVRTYTTRTKIESSSGGRGGGGGGGRSSGGHGGGGRHR